MFFSVEIIVNRYKRVGVYFEADFNQRVGQFDNIIMANCFLDEPVANEYIHAKLAAKDGGKERP